MQRKLKLFWIMTLFVLPLFCASRDNLAVLKNDIERIIHRADPTAMVGIDIISMQSNQRLYSRNHKQRYIPASITKLFTLAAAFDILGIDYTYTTAIYTDGKIENGVLHGNLYLKGSGDPTLSTSDLESLVKTLRLTGIERVKGCLIVDASAFDSTVLAPGWMAEDTADISTAIPSALSINQSCFDIWIRPGAQESSPAVVLSDFPSIDLPFQIDNQTLTLSSVQDGKHLEVTSENKDKQSIIHIAGSLALQSTPQHRRVPLHNPALMAGAIIKDLFKRYQIRFEGSIQEGLTNTDALMLAEHRSAPLFLIGQKMCKESDNFFAHCLFKTLGKEVQGPPGSWQAGSRVLRDFLATQVHLDPEEMVLLDGSGLSRYNLISPNQIVNFLSWAHHHMHFNTEFKAALSIAGIDGTLKNRMKDLQGKVRAKTGTLMGVNNLCGYLFTQDHEEIAVAIMVNGSTKEAKEIREKLIDPICAILVNFKRR